MKLSELNCLFLDGQTTGLSAATSELLELAWCASLERAAIGSILIRPTDFAAVPKAVWQVTGLTEAHFKSAVNAEAAWREVMAQSAHVLVIHYAQFEVPFLKKVNQAVAGNDTLPWPVVDTYKVAQRLCGSFPSKTIRALSGHWGYELPETNRAYEHVAATQVIWAALIALLEKEAGITTLEAFTTWLGTKTPRAKAPKSGRHYLFARENRLAFPAEPGIYEMYSRSGKILYIGKATSLKSRVNSYFTQRRTTRTRLHELMTQVADIRVTPTASALEAALLENERIKAIEPAYNVALRTADKPLVFVSRDLTSLSLTPDAQHVWGPFSHEPFESLEQLYYIARDMNDKIEISWLKYTPEEIRERLAPLMARYGYSDLAKVEIQYFWRVGKKLLALNPPTDEIEASLFRKMKRAGRAIHRMRWITELSRAQVSWKLRKEEWRTLQFCEGRVVRAETAPEPRFVFAAKQRFHERRSQMNRAQFDAARIVFTELSLFRKKEIPFEVAFSPTRRFRAGDATVEAPLPRDTKITASWLSRVAKPLPPEPIEVAEPTPDILDPVTP